MSQNQYQDISLQGMGSVKQPIQVSYPIQQSVNPQGTGSSIVAAYTELRQSMSLRQSQVIEGKQTSLMRQGQSSRANQQVGGSRATSHVSQASKKLDAQNPSMRAVYAEEQQQAADTMASQEDHKMPLEQLLQKFGVETVSKGLTSQQATQKNQEYGDNKLPEKKRTPGWLIFLKELFNWFSVMLWVGAILCIVGYFLETSQGPGNVYLAIVLITVIFITGSITYMQNSKSEALMDSFKNMIPSACSVIRDGTNTSIDPTKLVPGDIISVQSGDKLPADIRVIQSLEMKVDNSALTGESDPLLRSDKCTNDNFLETANMAFFGTLVKEGRGKGIVVKIGENTVLGQIADLASGGDKVKSPLRVELDRFVLLITGIALGLGFGFFFAAKFIIGYSWVDAMVSGIGILVANVPEGLLGCITISLAITAEKLAKKQVLVKNLEGVETLGSTSCICSDKTGTLTQNKMTVEHLWYDGNVVKAENRQKMGPGYQYEYEIQDPTFKDLHKCAITSSEAVFEVKPEDYEKTVWLDAPVKGDASETALVKFFQPIEDVLSTREKYKVVISKEGQPVKMPFNSTNKYALTIIEQKKDNSEYVIYIKGAPEKVWKFCNFLLVEGQYQKIDQNIQKNFDKVNLQFGKNGERVLGFAKLELNSEQFPRGFDFNVASPEKFNFEMQNFVFLGLISLQDPPKESVPYAVTKCRSAGIKVVMVTGDQPPTAGAIARQVNIIPHNVKTNIELMEEYEEQGNPITWHEATEMADAIVVHGDFVTEALNKDNEGNEEGPELDVTLQRWVQKPYCVFARTTPAHKLKIVRACQKVGYICGVTGDGVNDSPAIKQGDIGISMGITGSDVTKDAADMVLLNDDFASIVDGVEEGRKIFDNLKKTIVYLLTSNVTEIFPFIAQLFFYLPLPLSNMLMLCICVGTDILPALSLAYEKAEIDIMTRKPRTKEEHLVTVKLITHAYLQMGIIATAAGFYAYFVTMFYYGFTMGGLFGLAKTSVATATRGDLIPFGSYDINANNLGNPYLYQVTDQGLQTTNVDCTKNQGQFYDGGNYNSQYEKAFDLGKDDTTTNYGALDWLFYTDKQYDLRQILVQCDKETKNFITREDTFTQCETLEGSEEMSFAQLYDLGDEGKQSKPSHSVLSYSYKLSDYKSTNNGKNPYLTDVPICYSTEALKYAQTAYFIAVVIVQWSNVISVKAKKISFIFTPWNNVMLYGVILETVVSVILCYVPGVQEVFMSRPINFEAWWMGSIFSIFLLGWCETRKYLIRKPSPAGQKNFWDKNINW